MSALSTVNLLQTNIDIFIDVTKVDPIKPQLKFIKFLLPFTFKHLW